MKHLRKSLLAAAITFAAVAAPALASTPTPTAEEARETPLTRADAVYIDPRSLASNPDKYRWDMEGETIPPYIVFLRGTVGTVNVSDRFTTFVLAAQVQNSSLTEEFAVFFDPTENILRGDQLCVYGVPFGTNEIDALPAEDQNILPVIIAYDVQPVLGPNTGLCPKVPGIPLDR